MKQSSTILARDSMERVRQHVAESVTRADEFPGKGVWIYRCTSDDIESQICEIAAAVDAGRELPLLGMTFAVKDNIDVAGIPTTAACPAFSYTPVVSSTVVRRLMEAGAIVLGKTNLDQFATGLVGTRSPYGACENFFDPEFISGGSSSGSAVAVAASICDFSLGTDTAGSGRVPAAFNNLIGVKPSRGLISTSGVVPACRSLDCVAIFARELDTAQRVLDVCEGFDGDDIYSRPRGEITSTYAKPTRDPLRVGIPTGDDLEFFGDDAYAALFNEAVDRFESLGSQAVAIDYEPFRETAQLLYEGPWVAERLAAIHEFYDRHEADVLPVIRSIIGNADHLTAVDAFRGIYQLTACRRRARMLWESMDLLMLPTAGTIYTIDQVQADPIQLNKNLGYYTNFVNLLDLCALAIPAGFRADGIPFGVTLIAPAGNEKTLFEAAERFAGAQT